MDTDQQIGKINGTKSLIGVMKHAGTTEKIIGVFFEVYNELGHGFLESVYAESMAIGLHEAGQHVIQQAPLPFTFAGNRWAISAPTSLSRMRLSLNLKLRAPSTRRMKHN
jgi:hypothetical protein